MSIPKRITVKTSDQQTFQIEASAAALSQTIKHMIEDNCAENVIPLSNVDGKTMARVIEYCNLGKEKDSDVAGFSRGLADSNFQTLMDVFGASNYLEVKVLLDLTAQLVADKIKDMQPEEVREIFNITNDLSPEEEAAVRNQYPSVFEP